MTFKPAVTHGDLVSVPFNGPPAERENRLYSSELSTWVRVRGVRGADESHKDLWPGRGVQRERTRG